MSKVFGDCPFLHICECCGKRAVLTAKEAFDQGWDYPGEGGLFPEAAFGIVGPRTCGECPITETLWFSLVTKKSKVDELSNRHKETLYRIFQEPDIYILGNKEDTQDGLGCIHEN